MTWLDAETLAVARQLREPTASLREYTRRLRQIDPRGRVLFPGCARRIEDLRGSRFGMLTVLGYAGRRGTSIMWVCRCDCGKVGTKTGRNLTAGNSKSCGCQRGRKEGGA